MHCDNLPCKSPNLINPCVITFTDALWGCIPERTGFNFFNCGFLSFQYDFVDRFLFIAEFTAGRKGAGDIRRVVFVFTARIDENKVSIFDCRGAELSQRTPFHGESGKNEKA